MQEKLIQTGVALEGNGKEAKNEDHEITSSNDNNNNIKIFDKNADSKEGSELLSKTQAPKKSLTFEILESKEMTSTQNRDSAVHIDVYVATTRGSKNNANTVKPFLTKSISDTNDTKTMEKKEELSNELKTRLNQNPKRNRENSIINGRLLLKAIEQSVKEEEAAAAAAATSPANEIQQQDLNNNLIKMRNLSNGDRSYSDSSKRASLSPSIPIGKKYIDEEATLRQIGKLDNPNKPSLTQSRTFKLLQDTLDNGKS
jgi:hypothetical protein